MRIAILGAGLLGRLLALQLSQDHDISLFDKDDGSAQQSAAYQAAAMLAPIAESAEASNAIMQMGQRSLELWPDLLKQLNNPVFFQKSGSLVLAFAQDGASFANFQQQLKGQINQDYSLIDKNLLSELEPELAQQPRAFQHMMYLPDEGQLDNRQLLHALRDTLISREIKWHTDTQVSLKNNQIWINDKYFGFEEIGLVFDKIIDCRGLGAKAQLAPSSQLRGVRGEVLRLHAPQVSLQRPIRLMHPRYPIYIAPKQNHHFVVGATQIESEDNRQPTVRSALELLSACFSVHSGFGEAEIIEISSGLRPALQDNEPQIWINDHVIQLNGLFRHGYLLSPAMAEQCCALINDNIDKVPSYPGLITKL